MEKMIKNIKDVFTLKDSKEAEIQKDKQELQERINELEEAIDGIIYNAVIVEDKEAIKEYQDLTSELSDVMETMERLKVKEWALKKHEIDKATQKKANDLYLEIQKEIDKEVKKYGKLTTKYMDKIEEARKLGEELQEVELSITRVLPRKLDGLEDLLDLEALEVTETQLDRFKDRDFEKIVLFKDEREKHRDKRFTGGDYNRLWANKI